MPAKNSAKTISKLTPQTSQSNTDRYASQQYELGKQSKKSKRNKCGLVTSYRGLAATTWSLDQLSEQLLRIQCYPIPTLRPTAVCFLKLTICFHVWSIIKLCLFKRSSSRNNLKLNCAEQSALASCRPIESELAELFHGWITKTALLDSAK